MKGHPGCFLLLFTPRLSGCDLQFNLLERLLRITKLFKQIGACKNDYNTASASPRSKIADPSPTVHKSLNHQSLCIPTAESPLR